MSGGARGKRRRTRLRRNRATVNFSRAAGWKTLVPAIFCCGSLAATGCAGRRPVAAGAPPPAVRSSTAAPPVESSRRSPATPRPGGAAPRDRPERTRADGYSEEGNASWYGPPFHGRRASNGEIYDMNKLTAAHRTMAFNTMVRVTNLSNGKSVVVRITDRGPFVENRIIDLSRAAAQEIESIGPGVVPVRLEVVSGSDPFGGYFTVQVGAFKEKPNADRLRERLDALYPPATIQPVALDDGTFYRVRVGRILGEQPAQRLADDLRAKEGFHAMVIRLDDETGGSDQ
ncbi:MAG TPA: septal ring lytic transglycosylase RlpA family protein [Candidatus Acidoferrum sp.]|nr:septal ring lytic transglycosylase RlpA family protein [Candidatus Acidoferrum sp.]